MKVILIIFTLFLNIISISKTDSSNLSYYQKYERFDFDDYYRLEKLRELNNYTYLETINYYYSLNNSSIVFPKDELVLINKFFKAKLNSIPLINIDDYKITYPSIIKTTKDDIQIQKIVIEQYIKMIAELKKQYQCINNLYIFSGYRSFSYQEIIYKNATDKSYVAYPGYSEHESGLAIDVSTLYHGLTKNFMYSKEYNVLINNAYKYGFILRYPSDKTSITLYSFEPWHLRYVGTFESTYMYKHNLCLEEYLFKNYLLVK